MSAHLRPFGLQLSQSRSNPLCMHPTLDQQGQAKSQLVVREILVQVLAGLMALARCMLLHQMVLVKGWESAVLVGY
jgi:hypothetical protein